MIHPCECTTAMLRTMRSRADNDEPATTAPSSPLCRRGPASSVPHSGECRSRVSISSQSARKLVLLLVLADAEARKVRRPLIVRLADERLLDGDQRGAVARRELLDQVLAHPRLVGVEHADDVVPARRGVRVVGLGVVARPS